MYRIGAKERDDLDQRLARMASVGATLLSNATAARRTLAALPVVDAPESTPPTPAAGYGADPYGHGSYGGAP